MGSGIKKSDLTLHRGNIYENHLYIIFLDNNKYGQAELCIVNFFTDSGYL